MGEVKLNSHWDNPNGPRCMMKRVYYKADVDKLLERSLVLDSWDEAFEIQEAILYRIKLYCNFAQSHKYFNDKERYEKNGVLKMKKKLLILDEDTLKDVKMWEKILKLDLSKPLAGFVEMLEIDRYADIIVCWSLIYNTHGGI